MSQELTEEEFRALISLLDDTDEEVYRHVNDRLRSVGLQGIPRLEAAWEQADHSLLQRRLEEIIQDIQHNTLKDELARWIREDTEDLLLGALLVAKFRYPELDVSHIYSEFEKITQNVWLELNNGLTPMEEVNVMNHVLYILHGFTCDDKDNYQLDEGFINKVLETKKGNSVTLGIIYLIIARQLELPIYGINLPYHFVLGYSRKVLEDADLKKYTGARDILFYINPMNDGSLFSRNDIHKYLDKLQRKPGKKYFAPCSNEEIIKSLIRHQIICYEEKDDQEAVRELQAMLSLFGPEPAEEEETSLD